MYDLLSFPSAFIKQYLSLSCYSEYYFSDENLQKDFFLRRQVCALQCMQVQACTHPHIVPHSDGWGGLCTIDCDREVQQSASTDSGCTSYQRGEVTWPYPYLWRVAFPSILSQYPWQLPSYAHCVFQSFAACLCSAHIVTVFYSALELGYQ